MYDKLIAPAKAKDKFQKKKKKKKYIGTYVYLMITIIFNQIV